MNLKKWQRNTVMVGLLAIPLVLTGCGFLTKSTEPIDPPQEEQAAEQPTTSWILQHEGGDSYQVYLQDKNGYLAPISLPVVLTEDRAVGQQLLELMVDGGLYATMMPGEFRALIPQGTEVLNYEVVDGVAMVDFSEPFTSYNEADERAIVESIVYTLTSLEEVKGVSISVNGQSLDEMPVAGYPLAQIVDRHIGINIEMAPGVNYSQAAPVTLYFSAQTLDAEHYFVPVTRMINREESTVVAAITELGEGPQDIKSLTPVMMPVEVSSYEIYDGVLHVDIQDESYEPGVFVPSQMLNAMILSLLDNTGVEAVQLRVNGDINIFDEHNQSYSEPVSKPEAVNALKL